MKTLDIERILAKTPQAKGRIVRANKILQGRLVKAMCLAGVSSIDEANIFLSQFIEDFNQRFASEPRSSENLHCTVNQSAAIVKRSTIKSMQGHEAKWSTRLVI